MSGEPDGKATGSAVGYRPRERRAALCLFALFLCVYALNASGHPYSADEITMIATAVSIAHGHGGALDGNAGRLLERAPNPMAMRGADGRYHAKYSPLMPELLAPAAAVGDRLQRLAPHDSPPLFAVFFVAGFLNALVTALTVAALFYLCLGFGLDQRPAALTASLFGLTTIALPYSKTCFSEPVAALLLTTCFACLTEWRRTCNARAIAVSALAAALLPLARVSAVVALPPLVIYALARRESRKAAFAVAGGAAVGLLIHGLFNFYRFGSFLETGYGAEAAKFTTPIVAGLYGLLISSDKSVFVYSPLLLLAIPGVFAARRRGRGAEAACAAGIFALTVLFHAPWHDWSGGHSWGPRFLVPLTPVCMAAAGVYIADTKGRRARVAAVAALAALGLAIQFSASFAKFVPQYENSSVMRDIVDMHARGRLFSPGAPRFLPERAQFRAAARHAAYTAAHARDYFRPAGADFKGLRDSKLVENAPDYWPFLVWLSGGAKLRALTAAIVLAAAIAAMLSLRMLLKALKA